MDELPGEIISKPDWFDSETLDTLADAYHGVHSAFDFKSAQVDRGHPLMELTKHLFDSLPAAVKADVEAVGGMPSGLVHGDPHAGNWLWVQADRSVNLVDWGDAHVGWPTVEIARCAIYIAERAGEDAGLSLLGRYFQRGPKPPAGALVAGHMIAQLWPRGDDEALARIAQIDEPRLQARRNAYVRAVLDNA